MCSDPNPAPANTQSVGPAPPPATSTTVESHEAPGQDDAIEADNELNGDADSALGSDDVRSFTTSVASSIYNYTYEVCSMISHEPTINGRRYHAYREGEYLFPNDDKEQDRLDMLHHIFKLVLRGRLYNAPLVEPVQNVLDFGTGTGIWAIDFADENESTQIVVNDLSPIQPSWVPPNLKFVVDDVEAPWPTNEHEYDYIHGRSMSGSISSWSKLFTEALAALKPGGWLEMQEFDVWFQSEEGELPKDSAISEWQNYLETASTMFGKRLNAAGEMAEAMRSVGFVDVRDDIIKVPIGAWPRDRKLKEQGRWLQAHMLESIEPISLGYCSRILKWSDIETKVLIARTRSEFLNNKTHLYANCHFIYGRKLSDGPETS